MANKTIMLSRPPISIVTPSYNQAEFLEQTIRSVLAQDVPGLEYILIDGGSTDGSVEIIRRYESRLAWWTSEPDEGQAHAINKGLQRATGQLVAWINSDDMYAPGAVAQAIKAFRTDPEVGLIYGDAVSFNQNGLPLNNLVFDDWGLDGLMSFEMICQPAVFMRREVLEQVGYLNPSYHYLLDHELWLRIARRFPINHLPSVWAFARHHSAAKNVAHAVQFGREAYRLLRWMETQPDLADRVEENQAIMYAGAHRFTARYLLDAGQPRRALKTYLRSLRTHPPTALTEWHRILFAGLSLLGLGKMGHFYYRLREKQLPSLAMDLGIEDVNTLYGSVD